jgi:hypothetical protein
MPQALQQQHALSSAASALDRDMKAADCPAV